MVNGVITHREVLKNVGLIRREFGTRCLLRCLWACFFGGRTTFLSVAFRK